MRVCCFFMLFLLFFNFISAVNWIRIWRVRYKDVNSRRNLYLYYLILFISLLMISFLLTNINIFFVLLLLFIRRFWLFFCSFIVFLMIPFVLLLFLLLALRHWLIIYLNLTFRSLATHLETWNYLYNNNRLK